MSQHPTAKLSLRKWRDTALFLLIGSLFFGYLGYYMGLSNMLKTMTETAYHLLLETVFLTMAVTVLAGAIGKLIGEFGLTSIINWLFGWLMRPLYGLPGISLLGASGTFLSDNMTIITFTRDRKFISHFRPKEIPLLCNLGTSYGMGLMLVTFLITLGYVNEAIVGSAGALVGSVVSIRMMAWLSRKASVGPSCAVAPSVVDDVGRAESEDDNGVQASFFERFLGAILDGGRFGVEIGLSMIPGVLIFGTGVLMLCKGMPAGGYTGAAYQGVPLIPMIGEVLQPVMDPLFGFTHKEIFALPMTALGAAGAAVSLLQQMHKMFTGHEIAVFASFAILWSGFLSTHVAILDELGFRKLVSIALASHFVAGLVAGMTANFLYKFCLWVNLIPSLPQGL